MTSGAEILTPERKAVGRPRKISTLVPARTLPERAAMVNHYHNSAAAAYAQAGYYAIYCGLELMAAQETVEHGEWIAWIDANCEFEERTARKYMALANGAMERLRDRMGVFGGLVGDVAPSLMKPEARRKLTAAVAVLADGKTIHELQLELGIVKERVPGQRGGANNPYGRIGNPDTVIERLAAEKADARRDWAAGMNRMVDLFETRKAYRHCDRENMKNSVDVLRGIAEGIEEFLKSLH